MALDRLAAAARLLAAAGPSRATLERRLVAARLAALKKSAARTAGAS